MKKFCTFVFSIILSAGIVFAGSVMYSNEYIKHLKDCNVYIEKYDLKIPPQNTDEAPINVKVTESLLGWKNGICLTKSVVHSTELKKDIISTNCGYSEKQLESVIKMMNNVNIKDGEEKYKAQNTLTKFLKDNSICVTKNLID